MDEIMFIYISTATGSQYLNVTAAECHQNIFSTNYTHLQNITHNLKTCYAGRQLKIYIHSYTTQRGKKNLALIFWNKVDIKAEQV